MKAMLNRTTPLRLLAVLLAFMLMLSVAVLPVGATAPVDSQYARWTYHDGTGTLTGDFPAQDDQPQATRIYTSYPLEELPRGFWCLPVNIFNYSNTVQIRDKKYHLLSPYRAADIMMAEDRDNGETLLFLTENGFRNIQALAEQTEFENLRLVYTKKNDTVVSNLAPSILKKLNSLVASTADKTLPLSSLQYAPSYEVVGFDQDNWAGVALGTVVNLNGVLYYFDNRPLPDSVFTETGSLDFTASYEIALHELTEDLDKSIGNAVEYACTIRYNNSYEHNFVTDMGDVWNIFGELAQETVANSVVYVSIAILGIALPIAPLTVGLCMPHSDKHGRKKRWYLMAGLGGTWLLIGVLMLIMMILVL